MKTLKLTVMAITLSAITLLSCEKDNLVKYPYENEPADSTWGLGDSIPIISPIYFFGKVGSEVVVIQDTTYATFDPANDYTGVYVDTLDSIPYGMCGTDSYFYGFKSTLTTNTAMPIFSVEFLNCYQDSTTLAKIENNIVEGAYPYGRGSVEVEGVEISYVDEAGRLWRTKPGSGLNTDNRFIITQIAPISPPVYDRYMLVNATFDVTLYRGTETMRIESGECGLLFGKFER